MGQASGRTQGVTIELIAQFVGAIGLIAVSIVEVARDFVPFEVSASTVVGAFVFFSAVPVLALWRQAVREGRLPALPSGAPKHNHISGWGFLALAFAVVIIVGIAAWAAPGTEGGRGIESTWGVAIVVGLALFFVVAAVAPNAPEVPRTLTRVLRVVGFVIAPFGRVLSILDSMMVFAVAGAVGASRASVQLRYFFLAATLIPGGVVGSHLQAPWGLIPLAWGFFVAISISRRWAWVEDDRELSMLNRRYTGSHLRVGFGQDLRDEALLSFMSMFILIPLALQQAQAWSMELNPESPLFRVTQAASLIDWISFYGTELAKAVPFVDWAEIYGIGSSAAVIEVPDNNETTHHVVFATRVLVDLVFLAALLQAIGISTRNARQKELFFGETQALDRLDPFIEPREFRKLLRVGHEGKAEPIADAIERFPKYDPVRLGELCDEAMHPDIFVAARALSKRDGGANSEALHDTLLERALALKPDPAGLREVITAIRTAGPKRLAYELGQARVGLNIKASMNDLRTEVMKLLIEAPRSDERTEALVSALSGEYRDSIWPIRRLALRALHPEVVAGDQRATECLRYVSEHDNAPYLRNEAKELLGPRAG